MVTVRVIAGFTKLWTSHVIMSVFGTGVALYLSAFTNRAATRFSTSGGRGDLHSVADFFMRTNLRYHALIIFMRTNGGSTLRMWFRKAAIIALSPAWEVITKSLIFEYAR